MPRIRWDVGQNNNDDVEDDDLDSIYDQIDEEQNEVKMSKIRKRHDNVDREARVKTIRVRKRDDDEDDDAF